MMVAAASMGGRGPAILHQIREPGPDVIDILSSGEESGEDEEVPNGEDFEEAQEEVGDEEEQEDDEDDDREWEIITVEDDDDPPRKAPKDMVCFRCPNKTHGRFKDEKKFWFHVKRHILPDHYACPTCCRPFTKMSYLQSHELRVHGTPIIYDSKKDAVLKQAKDYQNERERKMQENPKEPQYPDGYDEDGNDLEDYKFYDNRYTHSTAMYPYRGPSVDSMLECYEIQYCKPRPKDKHANVVTKVAVDIHIQNVTKGQDAYKFGRFFQQKGTRRPPQNPVMGVVPPGTTRDASPAPSTSSSSTISKTVKETDSDDKATLKRKRIVEFGSDSEEDEEVAVTYQPSNKKKRTEPGSAPKAGKSKAKRVFKPVLDQHCKLCGYVWNTEVDLRSHRDTAHPGIHILELTAEPVRGKAELTKIPEKKTEPVKLVTTAKRKRNQKESKGPPVKKRKGRSQGLAVRRPAYPMPDATFTEKERFLFALGLSNVVRVHLHEKKSPNSLNLRRCSVALNRLTQSQIEASNQSATNLSSLEYFLSPHFLLS